MNVQIPKPSISLNIFIHQGGKDYGPFEVDEIKQHLRTGTFHLNDLAWHEGLNGWKPLNTMPEVVRATLPPLPPPPPVILNASGIAVPQATASESTLMHTPNELADGSVVGPSSRIDQQPKAKSSAGLWLLWVIGFIVAIWIDYILDVPKEKPFVQRHWLAFGYVVATAVFSNQEKKKTSNPG